MPIINIPGHGQVNFPDSMSNAEIEDAIKNNILGGEQKTKEISENASPIVKGITKGVFGIGKSLGYSPEQIASGISGAANNPLTNASLGFGDAQRNLMAQTANIIPGVNIPMAKTGEGTAYNLGKLGGDIAGFMEGGAGLKTLNELGALNKAGMIGKGAQALLNNPALSRIGGSAAYGAITNPDNRLMGATLGGGLGAASEVLPYATSLVGKPRETAQAIKDYIKSKHDRANDLYNAVKEGSKDTGEIYKLKNPMYSSQRVYGQYKTIEPEVFKANKEIENAHEAFENKPNYENAHSLQTNIGNLLGDYLGQREITAADKKIIDNLSNARNAIRADMLSHLDRNAPELANKYREASDIYKEIIDPKRLLDKFRNPGPKEVLNELKKVNERTKYNPLNPELQSKFNQLNSDVWKQRAALLGTLGIGGLGHQAHLLEGLIAGKLLGLKAPPTAINAAQNVFKGIGAGARGIGTGLKATIPPAIGE